MEDLGDSEKFAFQEEVVRKKVTEIVEAELKGKEFEEAKVEAWTNSICEQCIEAVHAPKNPFKYVVTCSIMQRTGAGIHSATSCYWDTVADSPLHVHWPKTSSTRELTSMMCIVTVFAVAYTAAS